MMRLIFLMIAYLFTGCVSIRTHELAKIESFQAGVVHGVYMSTRELESGVSADDALFTLKAFLDTEEMRGRKRQ